ncbi:hypothetical protein Cadr_000010420 [Camelus dromedarius]|uniref:Uncharacterized protein n=1 Tax=Camelus dromedarius TaxID=9838 RepID=A0A5N4DXR0_CAMDR|nr:hypothetical protein Cadr_000010420 [Camelus dromedarius]
MRPPSRRPPGTAVKCVTQSACFADQHICPAQTNSPPPHAHHLVGQKKAGFIFPMSYAVSTVKLVYLLYKEQHGGILGTAETGWWQPSNSHMEMQAVSSAADDIPEDISHQQRDYVLWQQQKLARAGWAPAFPGQDIRRSDRGEHPAYPQLPNL